MGPCTFKGLRRVLTELTLKYSTSSKRIKPLLKREVNNETFFTSLKSYYPIGYITCYAVYILFLVKDRDTTRNFNVYKCLHL